MVSCGVPVCRGKCFCNRRGFFPLQNAKLKAKAEHFECISISLIKSRCESDNQVEATFRPADTFKHQSRGIIKGVLLPGKSSENLKFVRCLAPLTTLLLKHLGPFIWSEGPASLQWCMAAAQQVLVVQHVEAVQTLVTNSQEIQEKSVIVLACSHSKG